MPTTTTPAAADRVFPTDRVWVLKLHAGSPMGGRIEHLVTGRQRAFDGAAELLALLADGDHEHLNFPTEHKP